MRENLYACEICHVKATEKHSKHEENLAFSTKCFEVVLRVVVGAYASKT